MSTLTGRRESERFGDEPVVDPRAPRFGQAITAVGLLGFVVLQAPALLFVITAILLAAVLTRWRFDPYAIVWRTLVQPIVGAPTAPEPAAPHRFAKVMGATGTTLASALLLAGLPLAAAVIAIGVALAAGLAAVSGLCLGCRMYQQVGFLRRLNLV